ncbi:MAG: alanine--glyoxylate aminotransferase family protein [Acidobacteriota bacterium]
MSTSIPSSAAPPQRILLGPGPSDVPPTVLEALARPTIGHLDPAYLNLMDELREMLRIIFRTDNAWTLAIPGTGSAGMEACVANLTEPGDRVLVVIAGVFGGRMAEVARRCGADVETIEVPWGETVSAERIAQELDGGERFRWVGLVHAETSTGAHQPLEEISRLVHDAGALFVVDAVTSLAGMELEVDGWAIDACYSGTQKCLSCPPGLAPVTFSDAALARVEARSHPVQSWYLDLTLIGGYWGGERAYHHTAPINMSYALHEAVRLVLVEGLEARIARHARHHRALRAGLEALGLRWIPERTLTTLNAVHIPDGVDDARVRRRLLGEFGIEIGAGLGPFRGRAWRIGLMGASSQRRHVLLVLAALERLLIDEGHALTPGAATDAAFAALAADAPSPN